LGFVFAVLAKSQAILLDGVYALVSVLMAVAGGPGPPGWSRSRPPRRSHFGYAHFEPLLNLIRGLLIFAICAYALVATIEVLVRGGREIHPEIAIWYTALSAVWSVGIFLYQRQLARKARLARSRRRCPDLAVDAVLYVGETGAFIVYMLLQPTALAPWLRYADPIFVLIVVAFLMKVPIMTIREGVREVLPPSPTARGPTRYAAANGDGAGGRAGRAIPTRGWSRWGVSSSSSFTWS